jgi:hypothetical protein
MAPNIKMPILPLQYLNLFINLNLFNLYYFFAINSEKLTWILFKTVANAKPAFYKKALLILWYIQTFFHFGEAWQQWAIPR